MTDRRDTHPGFNPQNVDPEVARDFFLSRASWLRPFVQENPDGGFDVVLRVDGAYPTKEEAEHMAEHFQTDYLDKIYGERP